MAENNTCAESPRGFHALVGSSSFYRLSRNTLDSGKRQKQKQSMKRW